MASDTRLSGRRLRLARAAWLAAAALALGLYLRGLPLYFAELQAPCALGPDRCAAAGLLGPAQLAELARLGLTPAAWAAALVALNAASAAVWVGVSAVIFVRRADQPMALFISFFLLIFGTSDIASEPLLAVVRADPAWWIVVQGLGFVGNAFSGLFAYLFPDGRFVPRWTAWLALAWIVISIPSYFFPGSPLDYQSQAPALNIAIFAGFLASFVSAQVIRYRRVSTPRQRQQTKWVVFGTATGVIGFVTPLVIVTLVPELEQTLGRLLLLNVWIYGAMLLLPLSFGVAILRSRLWDIDLLIRRTLIYSALTALLALVYLGAVVILQPLFAALTGQARSPLVTVLSTLAIAALFFPLRARVQTWIDRRFYRRKYDAAKTLAAFSLAIRDETNLDRLSAQLLAVVDAAMQSERVSLWLKPKDER
jgi:hypothetical protein